MKRFGFVALMALAIAGAPASSFAVCSTDTKCGTTGTGKCCVNEGKARVVCESSSTCTSSPVKGGAIGVDDGGPCAEPTDDGRVPDALDLQDCEGAVGANE